MAHVRVVGLMLCVALALSAGCRRGQRAGSESVPAAPQPAAVDPWQAAVAMVEQERGEPVGRQAVVEVPAQLKLPPDRSSFLAVQVAEWRKQGQPTPHDFAALADLFRRGELVAVPMLGADYILYGVGYTVTDEPFTHFDKATGRSITLYADAAEYAQADEQLAAADAQLQQSMLTLQNSLKETAKRDTTRRKDLRTQLAAQAQAQQALHQQRALLAEFYQAAATRNLLTAEYATLAALARDFAGQSFALQDAAARKAFKVRLLSGLRPVALQMLTEIARDYRAQFDRPLPVTSLVRPDEYQRQLHASNPNATLIDVPPHATGLAFDIYNRYMTAAEQNFLMTELARLQDAGRVEALRENRDHFHVFTFTAGRPPVEPRGRAESERRPSADPPAGRKPARRTAR